MAHRALTLKYRPQVFADMVGQDHVSTVLMRSLESGRVAHAYLFTGARGVGKTTSARILAKALNCQRRAAGDQKTADPCNVCTVCTEITAGVSLDVSEIDGASNRGIADVQALREKVRFTPTGGKYRVVIIDEVHQLSNDAFAALLKTLEEPPPHLVFIFATTDPQKLPETIRSRCQRYDYARVPMRKVADRLYEIQKRERTDAEGVVFDLTEGAAMLIAHQSEGSMRDAVSALDQVISAGEASVNEELVRRVLGIPDREAFFQVAEGIVKHDPQATLRALHQAFEKGLDPRELAEGLSEHLRAILILRVDAQGSDLIAASGEELARMRAQGEGWAENDLLRLLKIVSEVPWVMRDSPQPLVHLEAAVLQMATLEAGESLAQILDRLEALERRLGGTSGQAAPSTTGASGGSRTPPVGGMRATAPTAPAAPSASAPAPQPPARFAPAQGYRATPPGTGAAMPPSMGAGKPPSATVAMPDATYVAGASVPPVASAASGTSSASVAASAAATRPASAALLDEPAVSEPPAQALPSDERAHDLWRQVTGRINQSKRMLGAFLEESQFRGVSDEGLVIEADDLHAAVIEERDNRAIIHDMIREVFGAPIALRCVRPAQPNAQRAARTNADVQPMIEQAIKFFDGEAVDMTRKPEPPAPPRREWPSRKERPSA